MDTSLISAGFAWFARRALFFKVLGVGLLALLLLIPLAMVRGTLDERRGRHEAAVAEITQTWGRSQSLVGPILVVPYRENIATDEWVVVDGRRVKESRIVERLGEAWFLPEQLLVEGELEPQELSRGIFRTTVYTAKVRFSGSFRKPDFTALGLTEATPLWERARVGLALDDPRGIRGEVTLDWGGQALACEAGARLEGFTTGLHRTVDLRNQGDTTAFHVALALNGSGGFAVVPVGRQTEVTLTSPWPSPSFHGAMLPVSRQVDPSGFAATWRSSHHARSFPQQWSATLGEPTRGATALVQAALGVTLVDTVTAYRTVERSIKHGVLFITLVFAAFFLFEVLGGQRLHALNYLLVGAALCLFYLGLLALSEFAGFGVAYLAAAGASTALIGLYARAVLEGARRAWGVTAVLAGVYAYLFLVLRLEDFALLAGTAGLFAILAAIMYATRNLRMDAPRAEVSA